MTLNLTMVSLGEPSHDGAFPDVRIVELKVADLEAASKRCLVHIADRGLPRDRWAGGIVRDDEGTEIGQVSYSGIVYEQRTESRDKFIAIYGPKGTATDWVVEGKRRDPIEIPMQGFGTLSVEVRVSSGPAVTLKVDSLDGFNIDNRRARLDAKVLVDRRGVQVDREHSDLEWVEDKRFVEVDIYLAETVACTLREWLSHSENADLLVEHVAKRALFEIDEPLIELGQGDHRFERSRREVLNAALSYAAFKDAMEDLPARGLRP